MVQEEATNDLFDSGERLFQVFGLPHMLDSPSQRFVYSMMALIPIISSSAAPLELIRIYNCVGTFTQMSASYFCDEYPYFLLLKGLGYKLLQHPVVCIFCFCEMDDTKQVPDLCFSNCSS